MDARGEVLLHLVATLLRRADDGHRVDHLVGDEGGGSVALPILERLTHAVGVGAEPDAMHVLVIEDPHAADVERDVLPLAIAGGGRVVRHVDRHLRGDPDRVERASRGFSAGPHVGDRGSHAGGGEKDRQPAVG